MKTGVENVGVIDVIAEDRKSGEVVLMMNEPREWVNSPERYFQLQEKVNTYVSFILDGEMAEHYSHLMDKPKVLQLNAAFQPDPETMRFLQLVKDQMRKEKIDVRVRIGPLGEAPEPSHCCQGSGHGGNGCCQH